MRWQKIHHGTNLTRQTTLLNAGRVSRNQTQELSTKFLSGLCTGDLSMRFFRNSSGGRKKTITETSKNLHVRPGVWLKTLAVYMFEGWKGQPSLVARGKAAAIGTAATGT
jgi:hypothetical protein